MARSRGTGGMEDPEPAPHPLDVFVHLYAERRPAYLAAILDTDLRLSLLEQRLHALARRLGIEE